MLFRTGWGEGNYPAFWGLDEEGRVCQLVVWMIDLEHQEQQEEAFPWEEDLQRLQDALVWDGKQYQGTVCLQEWEGYFQRQEPYPLLVRVGELTDLQVVQGCRDFLERQYQILDVMMTAMDGFQVLQKIREKNNVPVLMLTAKSDEEDKVSGLRLGADDYLTKPFGINELMARVNSLIRRYTTLNPVAGSEAATMLLKDMVIDKVNRTVTLQNLPVELTGKEFDLLVFLASNKGRVFTKKQIYTQVWAEEYAFDDSNIMSFISKLRKKIEPNPEQPFYIQTVRGVGYRFNKEV